MATNGSKINFQVGFSVDKSGLSQMQSLFQQIANKAAEPANKMNAGLQQAAKTATTLDGILTKTFNTELGTLNVTKFNQELAKNGLTLKDVKANLSQVGNQGVTAFNRLSQAVLGTNQQIRQSSKALDQMFTTFKNTIRYGISSSVFNNMANSIQRAFDYSKQLDTSLNDIRIVTDKSAESMAEFAKQANEASKGMGASTLDYTNAALIYYQQGLTDAEVQARAETTIKAANVTGQTGEEVSEQLTAVWNGYKVSAAETEAYVDKLAAVAATTAADLEELSVGMSKVASAANAMGVDFDDLNAQIATIVSVTRQAPESVGTALKTIYARLGDLKVDGGVDEFGVTLGDVSEQLNAMGIQILKDNGDLRDMSSVIAEVAEKWGTWTQAQRQAAAVAMAGKRQYNNLIALFDNWDMYTDALNTSTDALGTLQHQQDIYMESTSAKLKTLKAAWQGLYDDAINEDEVNAGIEALTNLVEVFDNFISSFGGGLKSVAGFGAILSDIFNKQISESIINADQRMSVFKQNIDLLQTKTNAFSLGPGGELDSKATASQLGVEANTQKQLEIAQEIYRVRAGLNQEQARTLIGYQQETGELVEQKTVLENVTVSREKQVLREEQVQQLLQSELSSVEEIDAKYEQIVEDSRDALVYEQQSLDIIESIVENETNAQRAKQAIKQEAEQIINLDQQELDKILKQCTNMEKLQSNRAAILKLLRDAHQQSERQVRVVEEEAAAVHRVYEAKSQIYNIDNKIQNKEIEIKQLIDQGAKGAGITQQVTTITSAMGQLAMTWSSVNSLMDTWKNENIDAGDKIIQTMMTLGMTIPMVISNFNKLSEVFSSMNNLSIIANANEAAHIASLNAESVATISNTIIKENAEIVNSKNVKTIMSVITAEQLEKVATEEETASEILYAIAKENNIALNGSQIEVLKALIVKKVAEKEATEAATAAQIAAKTAAFATIGVLAALAIGIALVVNHYKKLREEAKKAAEESAKNAQALTSEYESNKNLISEYNDLYNQYKNGQIQKEELWDTTNKLIDAYDLEYSRLQALTGNYDDFTASINKAREAKEKEMKAANQTAFTNASINVSEQARGQGFLGINNISLSGNDTLSIGVGNFSVDASVNAHGDKEHAEQIKQIYKDIFETEEEIIKIDRNNPIQMLQFYERAIAFQQKLNEEGLITSQSYKRISQIINDLNASGALDNLLEAQQRGISGLLNSSGLESAESQNDFDRKKEQLREDLKDFIPNEEDINEQISSYIATINSSFADQSLIEDFVKEKWGNDYNKALYEIIKQYDPKIQAALLDQYHFDLTMGDTQKGIEELQKYVNYITNSPNGIYSIPFEMQMSTNETILKGKDISKSDWKGLTSSIPEAENILGSREEFNNKSIGERITLMEELNRQTQEQAHLAIEQYDAWREGQEQYKKDLQNRIDILTEEAEKSKEKINHIYDPQALEQEREKLKEIEDELEKLSSEKYEIDLEVDDYFSNNIDSLLGGMIGEVITQADQLKMAAESVGEAWTIAADDVANFASVFPELMNEDYISWIEDGSIKLTELGRKTLNDTLSNNQEIMNSNKQVVIDAINDKVTELEADAEFQEKKIQALETFLNSSVEQEDAAQKAISAIEQAGAEYEETLRAEGLINEANAQTEKVNIGDQGNAGLVKGLDQLNQNINAVRENYAHIFDENYKGVLPGYTGVGVSVSSSYSEGTIGAYEGPDEALSAAVQAAKDELDAAKKQLSEDRMQIAAYRGAQAKILQGVNAADTASSRVQQGLAGKEPKDKKSGGSSKDKDKELKKLEEEFDRYWDIHKALDLIDRDLKKLDKKQENLYGRELINSLKQENALLENQAQLYEQLAAAQEAEAAELRNKLSMSGVAFDASGAVLNYAQATAQALAEYNKAIQDYNNGLLDDAALKIHEQKYEQFKKDLERYDTLFYQEMKETQEKIEDIQRQILANNLKAWEVEVQLKLDWKQLERDWNDFIKEVTSDFKKVFKDLRVEGKNMLDDARTYIGEEGTINTIINAVHDVTGEIDKIRSGQGSDMFESISQAQEKLKELNSELLDSSQALHDLWVEAWDNYLEGIDQVSDAFDKLIDRFERINDELEFQGKLIELLYGDEAYKLMSKLYEGQQRNTEVQIQSLKTQVDMWKELFNASGATMDNQMDWTADQEKYYEQWMEAQSELNDLVIEYIELLKKDYLNTVSDTLQELEKFISGSSLSDIADEWEKISADADKYYDSVEGAYYIQTLANKIDESIAKSSNLKAQQRLMKLREKEIDYLREKENLTEYDLKAAEMRYQIALKEIALEQAQQNKTSMKLTRNEQGNWTYQYIADEEDVATKRQELLDAYNNLYQLASDAYEANLEALQELQEKYLESAKAIAEDDTLTNEEKEQKLLELREWYLEQYALLSEENQLYRNDLAASGAGLLLEIYKQDEEAYESMTENERELVDALINANISDYEELDDVIKGNYDDLGDKARETYQEIQSKAREVMADTRRDWTSGAQTIADLWNKDSGSSVKTQVTKAYEQIEKANEKYKERVDWCAEAVERDFSEEGIVGAIQAAENETDSLRDKTVEMVETAIPYLQALRSYVDEIEAAWRSVQQAIMDAINLIQEYLRMMGEAQAASERQAQAATSAAPNQAASASNGTGSTSKGGKGASISYTYKATGGDEEGTTSFSHTYTDRTSAMSAIKNYDTGSVVQIGSDGSRKVIKAFATGGYTGDWEGTGGKLALLHSKELVLNEDDTKNFLAGINTVRELSSGVNGSIQDTIFKAVARTALELGNIQSGAVIGGATNNSTTDNVFNITAEFPNANNVDEIREAILSLPNIASQHVNSKLR